MWRNGKVLCVWLAKESTAKRILVSLYFNMFWPQKLDLCFTEKNRQHKFFYIGKFQVFFLFCIFFFCFVCYWGWGKTEPIKSWNCEWIYDFSKHLFSHVLCFLCLRIYIPGMEIFVCSRTLNFFCNSFILWFSKRSFSYLLEIFRMETCSLTVTTTKKYLTVVSFLLKDIGTNYKVLRRDLN